MLLALWTHNNDKTTPQTKSLTAMLIRPWDYTKPSRSANICIKFSYKHSVLESLSRKTDPVVGFGRLMERRKGRGWSRYTHAKKHTNKQMKWANTRAAAPVWKVGWKWKDWLVSRSISGWRLSRTVRSCFLTKNSQNERNMIKSTKITPSKL